MKGEIHVQHSINYLCRFVGKKVGSREPEKVIAVRFLTGISTGCSPRRVTMFSTQLITFVVLLERKLESENLKK
jgi:hypothetical protein